MLVTRRFKFASHGDGELKGYSQEKSSDEGLRRALGRHRGVGEEKLGIASEGRRECKSQPAQSMGGYIE